MTPGQKPTFSVAILHVPDAAPRRRHLAYMLEALGYSRNRDDLPFDVLSIEVSPDPRREGVWKNARRALRLRHPQATHHLTLNDDMIIVDGFWPALRAAIAVVPDRPVNLQMPMSSAPLRALEAGKHWIAGRDAVAAGALVWPVAMVRDFLAWESAYVEPIAADHKGCHDDHRFAIYLRALGVVPWTTVPLLTAHDHEIPSLLGHASFMGGKARTGQGVAGSPGIQEADKVDWTVGADAPFSAPAALGGPSRRLAEAVAQRMDRVPWTPTIAIPGRLPTDPPSAPASRDGSVLR